MTVCVAALAIDSKAIVLIADKALTYGDNFSRPAMQGESGGVEKRIEIGNTGWHVLVAGTPTFAEDVIRVAEARIAQNETISDSYPSIMDCMKAAYQAVRESAIVDQILRPNLLTKEDFVSRSNALLPLQDSYFLGIANNVNGFRLDCSLLVCGFDEAGEGRIFSVDEPGVVNSHELTGFHAIGSGAETAIAHLLFRAAEAEDELDLALYQAFEAKAHAEVIQGVGAYSDEWILTSDGIIDVPREIDQLLGDVYDSATQLPFKKNRAELEPKKNPPKNWEDKLKDFTDSV